MSQKKRKSLDNVLEEQKLLKGNDCKFIYISKHSQLTKTMCEFVPGSTRQLSEGLPLNRSWEALNHANVPIQI